MYIYVLSNYLQSIASLYILFMSYLNISDILRKRNGLVHVVFALA